jgi:hypothetical protein
MALEKNPVLAMMRDKPFRPFEIHTNSGETYQVKGPEMIAVSPGGGLAVVFDAGNGVALISMEHVADCVRPITRAKPKSKSD